MTLVFCTRNPNKVREVSDILGPGFGFLLLPDIGFEEEIEEPFDSLEENSLLKAQTVAGRFGRDTFAEDSGLFVESLAGEPGVRSARYAGPEADSDANMHLLLKKLQGHSNRRAWFKTVVTLILNGTPHQFTGICPGHIAEERSGSGGFGYDPIFIPEGHERSFAEFSPAEKNAISHRRKAFEAMAAFLKTIS
jgi:XTP/dITP diphosphohydrolase